MREIEELVGDVVILRNSLTYRELPRVYDNVVSVQPHTQVLEHYELDGNYIKTEQTNHAEYDEYGNALRMVVEINGANGDFVRKETSSVYRNDASAWLIGKPLNVEVTHTTREGTLTRSTGFEYDHATGALRSEVIEPGSSLSLTSEFEYDEYGNRTGTVLSGQGVEPRHSSATYDSSGRFPINRANALGHRKPSNTTRAAACRSGRPVPTASAPTGVTTVSAVKQRSAAPMAQRPTGPTSGVTAPTPVLSLMTSASTRSLSTPPAHHPRPSTMTP
ncbi:hypothetical protein [endosymbiont of Lamellibrachia barhami]|uniref:hypothetical protein n=1 Tax=endosymbiont of Lamellibrachia barhami TaxID=205975 RepID=UPI0015A85A43|nr:hypothetical protein [endosymbiont of Lamellibrachia barhami]